MSLPNNALDIPPRQALKAYKQALLDGYLQDGRPNPQKLLQTLSRHIDGLLGEICQSFPLPAQAALVAVGGYGRDELFPGSDVDVLILLDQPFEAELAETLEKLVQRLWDLGLEIGHSIRTIDECIVESAADITIQTALLEARLVCGNRKTFKALQQRYREHLDACAFFRAKVLELHQRHGKYEYSPYSLEPNCKESPGGLRDLQIILWVSRAAGYGQNWRELATNGLITLAEARQLLKTERAFKDIRIRLHQHTGRREDRLVFDVQTPIAEAYGFRTTGEGVQLRRASEYLMQRYYWAAKVVSRLNTLVLQNIEARLFPRTPQRRALNERFDQVNEQLDVTDESVFEHCPSAMLEAFWLMEEHKEIKSMSTRTLRALWHNRHRIDAPFRREPENRALFLKILQAPSGITHALRDMNLTGVLGRYLPNFRKIVGQMQHDLFHVYTVDQHIIMVVRNLRRFCLSEHAHEYPFCSELMANFPRPWRLMIAALFHDIAKGRGGDHSTLGAIDARRFCKTHGIAREDTELIAFLIENHLTMSQVAQKKDLSDPDVIREFAQLVPTDEPLSALYLLTVADIRGTSPKVWNGWKARLLEDLYRMTLAALGGEAPSPDHALEARQKRARQLLRLAGLPETGHKALWSQLDTAYFLRHEAEDIAWQTGILYDRIDTPVPIVRARLMPAGEALQITVYVQDQPDLFARICSYFDRKNFGILDARIHTTKNGYALDTFVVTQTDFEDHYRDIITLIEHELSALLREPGELPAPTRGRLSRLSRNFPIASNVELQPDERGKHLILSISANDRNGLLYSIAQVLTRYRVNLHTAKIMTLGERVEDVLLIDGPLLNDPRQQIRFETDLLEALKI